MTVQELHYAVDQGLQKIGSYAYDNFLPEEIDYWLNRAQERFVKDRAFISADIKGIGFVGNQKRLDDLRQIISINYVDDTAPQAGAESQQYDLPVDYMFLVNIRAQIRANNCSRATTSDPLLTVPVRIVNNAEVHYLQQDPFARSQVRTPLATLNETDITVFQDNESFILEGITLDYIRTPQQISLQLNQTSELAEHTHHEIVDIAINTMLEAIESQRYQTNSNELSTTE